MSVIFRLQLASSSFEFFKAHSQIGVIERQNFRTEYRRIYGPGSADSDGSYRYSRRHLNDRVKRILTCQRGRVQSPPDNRNDHSRSQSSRQGSGHPRPCNDHPDSSFLRCSCKCVQFLWLTVSREEVILVADLKEIEHLRTFFHDRLIRIASHEYSDCLFLRVHGISLFIEKSTEGVRNDIQAPQIRIFIPSRSVNRNIDHIETPGRLINERVIPERPACHLFLVFP